MGGCPSFMIPILLAQHQKGTLERKDLAKLFTGPKGHPPGFKGWTARPVLFANLSQT